MDELKTDLSGTLLRTCLQYCAWCIAAQAAIALAAWGIAVLANSAP